MHGSSKLTSTPTTNSTCLATEIRNTTTTCRKEIGNETITTLKHIKISKIKTENNMHVLLELQI